MACWQELREARETSSCPAWLRKPASSEGEWGIREYGKTTVRVFIFPRS